MQVLVWSHVKIQRDGVTYVMHACRNYHDRHRNDFVHVRSDVADPAFPWLARLMAIINVQVLDGKGRVGEGFLPLAIVQWLQRTEDIVPGIPTYEYLPDAQAIEIESIERPVKLLDSPCEVDGTSRVCALPYGKSAAFNQLF